MNNSRLFSKEWMDKFRETANTDRELSWIGKFLTCDFLWKIGDDSYLLHIDNGKIQSIDQPTWNDSWDFIIEGSVEAWHLFCEPVPPPMYYDLLGMVTRLPDCNLTGNRLLAMQHMRALTRLMALVREVRKEEVH